MSGHEAKQIRRRRRCAAATLAALGISLVPGCANEARFSFPRIPVFGAASRAAETVADKVTPDLEDVQRAKENAKEKMQRARNSFTGDEEPLLSALMPKSKESEPAVDPFAQIEEAPADEKVAAASGNEPADDRLPIISPGPRESEGKEELVSFAEAADAASENNEQKGKPADKAAKRFGEDESAPAAKKTAQLASREPKAASRSGGEQFVSGFDDQLEGLRRSMNGAEPQTVAATEPALTEETEQTQEELFAPQDDSLEQRKLVSAQIVQARRLEKAGRHEEALKAAQKAQKIADAAGLEFAADELSPAMMVDMIQERLEHSQALADAAKQREAQELAASKAAAASKRTPRDHSHVPSFEELKTRSEETSHSDVTVASNERQPSLEWESPGTERTSFEATAEPPEPSPSFDEPSPSFGEVVESADETQVREESVASVVETEEPDFGGTSPFERSAAPPRATPAPGIDRLALPPAVAQAEPALPPSVEPLPEPPLIPRIVHPEPARALASASPSPSYPQCQIPMKSQSVGSVSPNVGAVISVAEFEQELYSTQPAHASIQTTSGTASQPSGPALAAPATSEPVLAEIAPPQSVDWEFDAPEQAAPQFSEAGTKLLGIGVALGCLAGLGLVHLSQLVRRRPAGC